MDYGRAQITAERANQVLSQFESKTQQSITKVKYLLEQFKQSYKLNDDRGMRVQERTIESHVHELVAAARHVSLVCAQMHPEQRLQFIQRMQPVKAKIESVVSEVRQVVGVGGVPLAECSTQFEWVNDDEPPQTMSLVQYGMEQDRVQGELEQLRVYSNQVQQRAMHTDQLAQDVVELQDIMLNLSQLVIEQHEVVDSIEENVERAQLRVNDGSKSIKKAVQHSTAKYPIVGGVVGAAALASPVGLLVGLKTAVVAAVGGAVAGVWSASKLRSAANNEADAVPNNNHQSTDRELDQLPSHSIPTNSFYS